MICFKSTYLKIYFFADKSLLIVHWLAKPTSKQYKDALQLMLQLAREKQIKNWLINSLNIGQINIDNINWMYENWFPQFLQMPTERYACIAPNDVYYLLVLEDMFDYRKHKVTFDFQFFSDMNLALEWIREDITMGTALQS